VRSTGAEARRTGVSFDPESMGSDRRGCLGGSRVLCVFLISGESTAAGAGTVKKAGNNQPNQMAKMLWNEERQRRLRLGTTEAILQPNYAHHSEANRTECLSRNEDENRCAAIGRRGVGEIVNILWRHRKDVERETLWEIIVGEERKNGHYRVGESS